LKVTSERLPDSHVQLMIEADEEASRKAQETAYRQLVGRVNVPGFRRGKAPRQLLERMVGRETILREAAQIMLPELYEKAVAEAGIDPIYDPDIDIISLEPLAVKVNVPVRPTVKLPDYRSIRLPKPEVNVTDEQVEEALQGLREQHAEWAPVERPVQQGDTAVIDATAEQGEERILEQTGIEYLVEPARNIPVPGFAEQLYGMQAGEEKSFVLRFPEDYAHAELAGKEANFHVVVHAVKEKHLPGLDDDLAKTAGEYDTLAQLRDSLREQIQKRAQEAADDEYQELVLGTVLNQADVELPAEMVEEQTEGSLHSLEDRLRSQGASMPEYLSATKQTRLQLLDTLRDEARATLRRQLVLNEVAKEEGIDVGDAEVSANIEESVALLGGDQGETLRKALDTEESRRNIAFRLRQRKTRERLAEIASQPAPTETKTEGAEQ